jgi:hypothetical protein
MNKVLLVFQLVQILENVEPAEQPSKEIYFYSLSKCVAVAEGLRDQRNRSHYRYSKGEIGAYCKAVYVKKEKEEAGLIWD